MESLSLQNKAIGTSSALGTVLVVAAAVSVFSLTFDFVLYDDDYLVFKNPTVQDLGNIGSFFNPAADRTNMGPEYLPIATTSLAVDCAVYGLRPWGFHLTNVILYVLGCLAVYLLLEEVFRHRAAALAGALLFAVHPLHTESFAWISERKTLLNGLFVTLSLLGYVRYRQRDSRRAYYASIVFFLLASLSKYTAASFPLALLAYDFTLGRKQRGAGRAALAATIPFFLLAGLMTWIAIEIGARYQIIQPASGHLGRQALNDPAIFLFYTRLLLLPVHQCAYYLWPLANGWTTWNVLGAFLGLGMVALAWRWRARLPHLSFALSWYIVLLLPVLNFVPKGLWVAERYLYLSTLALSVAASWLVWKLAAGDVLTPRRVRIRWAVGAWIVILGCLSISRSLVWRDSETLWRNTLAHPLCNPASHDQLGVHYLTVAHEPGKALAALDRGLEEMERRGTPRCLLAANMQFHRILCYLRVDRREEARREWHRLSRLCLPPEEPRVLAAYTRWRAELGQVTPWLMN